MVSELAQRELVPFLTRPGVMAISRGQHRLALTHLGERRTLHKQFLQKPARVHEMHGSVGPPVRVKLVTNNI